MKILIFIFHTFALARKEKTLYALFSLRSVIFGMIKGFTGVQKEPKSTVEFRPLDVCLIHQNSKYLWQYFYKGLN